MAKIGQKSSYFKAIVELNHRKALPVNQQTVKSSLRADWVARPMLL
jgi:hypothetical protein